MDFRSPEQRREMEIQRSKSIDRLRVTRELSKNQYNRLCQYEKNHGEQTPEQIAKMFKLSS